MIHGELAVVGAAGRRKGTERHALKYQKKRVLQRTRQVGEVITIPIYGDDDVVAALGPYLTR